MIEHNKKFYSLEELERTRDSLKGYLDNEEVYYFVGAIRYACDEIERLKEELKELNGIIEIGRKREYHSKFLKDFQKERGKNVFPDHDEIYKRYDDYKSRVEKAIEYIEYYLAKGRTKNCKSFDTSILDILKGVDKE